MAIRFLELNALKPMGKYLIVKIEISLALYENGAGGGIEVIDGIDEPHVQGLLEPKKEVGVTGMPTFLSK